MARELWGKHHVEPSDRIRAAEDRHPRHLLLRGGWIFAQRLGLLGPPAGGEPHRGDRRRLGEHVQGDAQSAHRPLHDQPDAEFRRADGRRYREISAQHPRHRDAGDGQRARPARRPGIRSATDAGAGIRPPVQDDDHAAEGVLGSDGQAEGLAPSRTGQGIHGYDERNAGDAGEAVRHACRRRQSPGRDDRPVAGDQADRLAVAQHRRRGLADRLDRAQQPARSRRRRGWPTRNIPAASTPHGARWS